MKYIEYKVDGYNCIIRTSSKLFNKECSVLLDELKSINENYTEIEVFEKYLNDHNYYEIDGYKDKQIKDLELDNSNYAIFCWDHKDYYHMVPVINNCIYDKYEESLELYVIKIYKGN